MLTLGLIWLLLGAMGLIGLLCLKSARARLPAGERNGQTAAKTPIPEIRSLSANKKSMELHSIINSPGAHRPSGFSLPKEPVSAVSREKTSDGVLGEVERMKLLDQAVGDLLNFRLPSQDHAKQTIQTSSAAAKATNKARPASWVRSGQQVSIAGLTIDGGMIYVGSILYEQSPPCLIDPSLLIAPYGDLSQSGAGYYPSYATVTSTDRRAYLDWLYTGRKDPSVNLTYLFLYFYGLERRVIHDARTDQAALADFPAIQTELQRLLALYGKKSKSFYSYANHLLNWIEFTPPATKLYERAVPEYEKTSDFPIFLKLALGQAARDRAPLPAQLALAWVRMSPEYVSSTAATRCSKEFSKLFEIYYHKEFGDGICLPQTNAPLRSTYKPAASDLTISSRSFVDITDVTTSTGSINNLRRIADKAATDLESFSRYRGRLQTEFRESDFDALITLPVELWPDSVKDSLEVCKSMMENGVLTCTFEDLLSIVDDKAAAPARGDVLKFASHLESMHIGLEPDVLGGAKLPKPKDNIVIFDLVFDGSIERKAPVFQASLLTLQLSSAVASSDGAFNAAEHSFLRARAQSWVHLSPGHQLRLLAHLELLKANPVTLASLKTRLASLKPSAKEALAIFMTTLAQSDGEVTPGEIKMLQKVYPLLGLDSKQVFSDVHALSSGPIAKAKGSDAAFALDHARIAALQLESEKVSNLLSDIFTNDDSAPLDQEPISELLQTGRPLHATIDSHAQPDKLFMLELDDAHTALARRLLAKQQWSRKDLLNAASELGLMLDGALEHINDASFDKFEIAFTDGSDPVEVSPEIHEKVKNDDPN